MFHPNHSFYIKSLYKNILAEGSLFFDDRARLYIKNRARKAFKEYRSCNDLDRVKNKIKEARKRLHRIEQANRGNQKSVLKILEEVYGRNGKTRHALLNPFVNCHKPEYIKDPEPLIAKYPRTTPPPALNPALRSLITQHLGKKPEPELPIPAYKPLHPARKANLLWRYRSMLLDRVQVSLPFEILCELERKAGASPEHPLYSGNLVVGGPKWNDGFYLSQHQNMMIHLDPYLIMEEKGVMKRSLKLMDSPYATPKKPSLLEAIGEEEIDKVLYEYTPRQKKRLYKKLLVHVPLIDIISPLDVWNEKVKYKISTSYWVPQGITLLLEDVPSEEIIESTLSNTKKNKKIRRS